MRSFLLLSLLVIACEPSQAQVAPGADVQLYPAGQILTAHVFVPVAESYEFGVLAGYNRTRRRDWGKHNDERGGGPGGALRLIRFAGAERTGLFFGVRADLWSLDIDWEGSNILCLDVGAVCANDGQTDVLVLQPTVVTGYRFHQSSVDIDLTLSIGREFNVRTDGEAVGEGLILLAGISVGL